MSVRFKECLIVDPDRDAYCGKPATTNVGKLPACELCAIELRMLHIEDRLERLADRTAWLAARTNHPVTAKKWRGE